MDEPERETIDEMSTKDENDDRFLYGSAKDGATEEQLSSKSEETSLLCDYGHTADTEHLTGLDIKTADGDGTVQNLPMDEVDVDNLLAGPNVEINELEEHCSEDRSSDTPAMISDTIAVESDTIAMETVAESGSHGLECDTPSKETDLTGVESDTDAMESDTVVAESGSDTHAMESDTIVAEIGSDTWAMESDTIVAESGSLGLECDTPSNDTDMTVVGRDTDAMESDRLSMKNDSIHSLESDLPPIESDTIVADSESDTRAMEGETVVADSESDTRAMESETIVADSESDTHAMESETIVADSESDTRAMENETIVADSESDTRAMESETIVAESGSHGLEPDMSSKASDATGVESEAHALKSDITVVENDTNALESGTPANSMDNLKSRNTSETRGVKDSKVTCQYCGDVFLKWYINVHNQHCENAKRVRAVKDGKAKSRAKIGPLVIKKCGKVWKHKNVGNDQRINLPKASKKIRSDKSLNSVSSDLISEKSDTAHSESSTDQVVNSEVENIFICPVKSFTMPKLNKRKSKLPSGRVRNDSGKFPGKILDNPSKIQRTSKGRHRKVSCDVSSQEDPSQALEKIAVKKLKPVKLGQSNNRDGDIMHDHENNVYLDLSPALIEPPVRILAPVVTPLIVSEEAEVKSRRAFHPRKRPCIVTKAKNRFPCLYCDNSYMKPYWFHHIAAHRRTPLAKKGKSSKEVQAVACIPHDVNEPREFEIDQLKETETADSILGSVSQLGQTETYKPPKTESYKPRKTETFKPRKTETFKPRKTEPFKPRKTRTFKPRKTETFKPRKTETYKPAQTETHNPTQTETSKPSQTPIYNPRQTETFKPRKIETFKPAQNETNKQKKTETFKPRKTETYKSRKTETFRTTLTGINKPSETETNKPAQIETYKPAQTETFKPAQIETYKPGQRDTYKPAQTETYKPAQTETYQPAQTETYKPAQADTYKLGMFSGAVNIEGPASKLFLKKTGLRKCRRKRKYRSEVKKARRPSQKMKQSVEHLVMDKDLGQKCLENDTVSTLTPLSSSRKNPPLTPANLITSLSAVDSPMPSASRKPDGTLNNQDKMITKRTIRRKRRRTTSLRKRFPCPYCPHKFEKSYLYKHLEIHRRDSASPKPDIDIDLWCLQNSAVCKNKTDREIPIQTHVKQIDTDHYNIVTEAEEETVGSEPKMPIEVVFGHSVGYLMKAGAEETKSSELNMPMEVVSRQSAGSHIKAGAGETVGSEPDMPVEVVFGHSAVSFTKTGAEDTVGSEPDMPVEVVFGKSMGSLNEAGAGKTVDSESDMPVEVVFGHSAGSLMKSRKQGGAKCTTPSLVPCPSPLSAPFEGSSHFGTTPLFSSARRNKLVDKSPHTKRDGKRPYWFNRRLMYDCNDCRYSTETVRAIRHHAFAHQLAKNVTCDICQITFISSRARKMYHTKFNIVHEEQEKQKGNWNGESKTKERSNFGESQANIVSKDAAESNIIEDRARVDPNEDNIDQNEDINELELSDDNEFESTLKSCSSENLDQTRDNWTHLSDYRARLLDLNEDIGQGKDGSYLSEGTAMFYHRKDSRKSRSNLSDSRTSSYLSKDQDNNRKETYLSEERARSYLSKDKDNSRKETYLSGERTRSYLSEDKDSNRKETYLSAERTRSYLSEDMGNYYLCEDIDQDEEESVHDEELNEGETNSFCHIEDLGKYRARTYSSENRDISNGSDTPSKDRARIGRARSNLGENFSGFRSYLNEELAQGRTRADLSGYLIEDGLHENENQERARSCGSENLSQNKARSHVSKNLSQERARSHVSVNLSQNRARSHVSKNLSQNRARSHFGENLSQERARSHPSDYLSQERARSHVSENLSQERARSHPSENLNQDRTRSCFSKIFAKCNNTSYLSKNQGRSSSSEKRDYNPGVCRSEFCFSLDRPMTDFDAKHLGKRQLSGNCLKTVQKAGMYHEHFKQNIYPAKCTSGAGKQGKRVKEFPHELRISLKDKKCRKVKKGSSKWKSHVRRVKKSGEDKFGRDEKHCVKCGQESGSVKACNDRGDCIEMGSNKFDASESFETNNQLGAVFYNGPNDGESINPEGNNDGAEILNTFHRGQNLNTFQERQMEDQFQRGQIQNTFQRGHILNTFKRGQMEDTFQRGQIQNTFEKGQIQNTFQRRQAEDTFQRGEILNTFQRGQTENTFNRRQTQNTVHSERIQNTEQAHVNELSDICNIVRHSKKRKQSIQTLIIDKDENNVSVLRRLDNVFPLVAPVDKMDVLCLPIGDAIEFYEVDEQHKGTYRRVSLEDRSDFLGSQKHTERNCKIGTMKRSFEAGSTGNTRFSEEADVNDVDIGYDSEGMEDAAESDEDKDNDIEGMEDFLRSEQPLDGGDRKEGNAGGKEACMNGSGKSQGYGSSGRKQYNGRNRDGDLPDNGRGLGGNDDDKDRDGNGNRDENNNQFMNAVFYPCLICKASYQEKSDVMKHLSKIHQLINVCQICYFDEEQIRRYANPVSLRNHKVRDHPESMVHCVCGAMLIDKKMLTTHQKKFKCEQKVFGGKEAEMVRCVCGKRFGSQEQLCAHRSKCRKRSESMSCESSVDMLKTQKPDTEEYGRQGKALDAGVLQTKGISDIHDTDINRHDKSSSLRNVNNVQEFIEHLASDVNNNQYSGMFSYSSEKRRQRGRKCKDRVLNYSENYYDNMLQAQARLLLSENLKPKGPINITESGGPQTFAKRKIPSVAPCEYGPYTTCRNSYIDSGSVQYSLGKSGLSGNGVYTGSEAGTGAYSRLGAGSPWGIEPSATVRSGMDTQWQRKGTHHGEAGNIQAHVPRHSIQDPKHTEGSEVDIQWKRQALDHQDASILRGQAPSLLRQAPSPQLLSPSLLRQAPSPQLLSPSLRQQNHSHQLQASSLQQQAPSLHLLSPGLQWQAPSLGRLAPSCTVGSGVDIEWQEAVNNRGAADVVDVNNNLVGGSYTNPTIYKPRFNGTSFSAPVTPTQGTPTRGTNLSDGDFQSLDFNKNLIGSPALSQPTGQARGKRSSPLAKGVVPLKKSFEDKTGLCRENTGKISPGRVEKGKTSPVEGDKGKTSPGEDENGRTSPNKAGMGETATINKKGRRKTSKPDAEGRYPCKTCHRRFKKPYLYTHQKVVHARKQWVYVPSLSAKAKPAKK